MKISLRSEIHMVLSMSGGSFQLAGCSDVWWLMCTGGSAALQDVSNPLDPSPWPTPHGIKR